MANKYANDRCTASPPLQFSIITAGINRGKQAAYPTETNATSNPKIKAIPNIIQLNKNGGEGVVREFVDQILG